MSWEILDLRNLEDQASPTVVYGGLIYMGGARHVFTGAPESLKTLAAHALALEHVRAGGVVLLIDFEMGPFDTRDRLQEMGATVDDLERVLYVDPDTPATADTIGELIDRYGIQLVVIDAAAGAYRLHGLNDNRRDDVERLAELLIAPCKGREVSTILIDHVVKNPSERGDWAIGSERKLGFADVSLGFTAKTPLRRGGDGLVQVRTNKDRYGHLPRGIAAEIAFHSDTETHAISWEFLAGQPDEATSAFRPTLLMERVSQYLENQQEPASRRSIEAEVKGKTPHVRAAIETLVREGYVTETDGPHRPLGSMRPFRQADDAQSGAAVPAAEDEGDEEGAPGEPQDEGDVPPVPRPPQGGHGGTRPKTLADDSEGERHTSPEAALTDGARPAETASLTAAPALVSDEVLDGLIARMPEVAGWPRDELMKLAPQLLERERLAKDDSR